MSRHTPGPWKVRKGESGYQCIEIESADLLIALVIGKDDGVDDQTPADAHLIASAPDLLKALNGIVGWCEHPSHGGKYDIPKPLEPYLLAAKIAIQEAEGL